LQFVKECGAASQSDITQTAATIKGQTAGFLATARKAAGIFDPRRRRAESKGPLAQAEAVTGTHLYAFLQDQNPTAEIVKQDTSKRKFGTTRLIESLAMTAERCSYIDAMHRADIDSSVDAGPSSRRSLSAHIRIMRDILSKVLSAGFDAIVRSCSGRDSATTDRTTEAVAEAGPLSRTPHDFTNIDIEAKLTTSTTSTASTASTVSTATFSSTRPLRWRLCARERKLLRVEDGNIGRDRDDDMCKDNIEYCSDDAVVCSLIIRAKTSTYGDTGDLDLVADTDVDSKINDNSSSATLVRMQRSLVSTFSLSGDIIVMCCPDSIEDETIPDTDPSSTPSLPSQLYAVRLILPEGMIPLKLRLYIGDRQGVHDNLLPLSFPPDSELEVTQLSDYTGSHDKTKADASRGEDHHDGDSDSDGDGIHRTLAIVGIASHRGDSYGVGDSHGLEMFRIDLNDIQFSTLMPPSANTNSAYRSGCIDVGIDEIRHLHATRVSDCNGGSDTECNYISTSWRHRKLPAVLLPSDSTNIRTKIAMETSPTRGVVTVWTAGKAVVVFDLEADEEVDNGDGGDDSEGDD
jgi:hypothetical protein